MNNDAPHQSSSLVTDTHVSPNHWTLIGLAYPRDDTGAATP